MPWFKRKAEVDVEKAEPVSPTRSTTSDETVGVNSRTVTAAETESQYSGKARTDTKGSLPGNEAPRDEEADREKAAKQEISETLTIPLEDYPIGYPRLASFQSSDSSFSIYRAFDYLHSRVILEMQDELRCLEEDLNELDAADAKSDDPDQQLRVQSREADISIARESNTKSKRADLLSQIGSKLVRYDEILMKARELNAFQRPTNRDYRSLRRWFCAEDPLTYPFEAQYIQRREDLITLRQGREWAGFDGWIESSIKKLPTWLSTKLFTTPELRKKTGQMEIHYFSPSRVEKLVGLLITLIIFALLVLPVVAMYELTSSGPGDSTVKAVGLLVVFTLIFSAAMSLLTKAKRHELFAASAAYCAVLVVFISNFSNDGNGGGGGRGA